MDRKNLKKNEETNPMFAEIEKENEKMFSEVLKLISKIENLKEELFNKDLIIKKLKQENKKIKVMEK